MGRGEIRGRYLVVLKITLLQRPAFVWIGKVITQKPSGSGYSEVNLNTMAGKQL